MTTTPTNGARKLARLEMTYDDGTQATLEGEHAQRWVDAANGCVTMAAIHGVSMPAGLAWQMSKVAPPNLDMDPATAQRLRKAIGQIDPQEEGRRNAQDQLLRDLARAVGMSPADSPAAIVARVREEHAELTALRPAVAAFCAAAKGLPSHVHTRPVCANAPSCDNMPRVGNLCARCYEQKEGRP